MATEATTKLKFENGPTHAFESGGLWERQSFDIVEMYGLTVCDAQCRHCIPCIGPKKYKHYPTIDVVAVCPRVVVATSEGGFNSTGVCLDCIREAAASIPG